MAKEKPQLQVLLEWEIERLAAIASNRVLWPVYFDNDKVAFHLNGCGCAEGAD